MANVLATSKQVAVLFALIEGASIRATSRMTGVSIPMILSLLGRGCGALHDRMMQNLPLTRIECNEIWGYVAKKQRHVRETDDVSAVGDTWTWVAIDAETNLVPSYRVGKRDGENEWAFVADLASRLTNKVQISTDGLRAYEDATELAFDGNVDYAQLVKEYEAEPAGSGRYSPPEVSHVEKIPLAGNPDLDLASTSYVERQNLTMRMQIRRMTRLTNAFSKKLEIHRAATALRFAHYKLCRRHQSLRMTPAMAAGVSAHMWTMEELLDAALMEVV